LRTPISRRRRLSTGAIILGALCCVSAPTRAASPQAPPLSQIVVSVFEQVCAGKIGSQSAMDTWLGDHGFRPATAEAAAQLAKGAPGRVWLNGTPEGPFAVITRPEGILCQVMAPTVDPESTAQSFREGIAALALPGRLDVHKQQDEDVDLAGIKGRRVTFHVAAIPANAGGFQFVLTVAPPRPGGVALLITASRAAP